MSKPRKELVLNGRGVEVYRLFIRGWQPAEISNSLGIPYSTVTWLIRESSRITDGQLARLSQEGVLRELWTGHAERKRVLWQLYTTAKLEIVKVACIKQLAEEDRRMEELAERMSILQPKPEAPIDINVNEKKDLRIRIDVRYTNDQLTGRFADLIGRLR